MVSYKLPDVIMRFENVDITGFDVLLSAPCAGKTYTVSLWPVQAFVNWKRSNLGKGRQISAQRTSGRRLLKSYIIYHQTPHRASRYFEVLHLLYRRHKLEPRMPAINISTPAAVKQTTQIQNTHAISFGHTIGLPLKMGT